jgi:hypothetical protein
VVIDARTTVAFRRGAWPQVWTALDNAEQPPKTRDLDTL